MQFAIDNVWVPVPDRLLPQRLTRVTTTTPTVYLLVAQLKAILPSRDLDGLETVAASTEVRRALAQEGLIGPNTSRVALVDADLVADAEWCPESVVAALLTDRGGLPGLRLGAHPWT